MLVTLQLGAVIIQKFKPIAFHIKTLTDAPKRYTVTEKEMLSTVETLKAFITILLGKILKIYTYHKNIICNNFNTGIVLIRRLIHEDYGPDIEYITGENNIVSYAL